MLLVAAVMAPAPVTAQQAPAGAPFSAFGYGETDVRGGQGRADLFFALAPDTAAAGETLVDLDISHSPLLVGPSTLTLLAGGVSVASARLDAANVSHGRLTARIPSELFAPEGLALSVRTALRLTDDQCEDPSNPALWATVHASSTVALGTRPTPRDLADAPELLTGRRAGDGVTFVLPASPDRELLRGAGIAAAEVGRWQAAQRKDALVGLAGAGDAAGPAVIVAAGPDTPAGFTSLWSGSVYTVDGRTFSGDQGVVALAQDGPPRLLVGGASPAAVARAAEALHEPLSGPAVALTGERAAPVVADADPWRTGAASFAQLGIDRQDLIGPGGARSASRSTGRRVGRSRETPRSTSWWTPPPASTPTGRRSRCRWPASSWVSGAWSRVPAPTPTASRSPPASSTAGSTAAPSAP